MKSAARAAKFVLQSKHSGHGRTGAYREIIHETTIS